MLRSCKKNLEIFLVVVFLFVSVRTGTASEWDALAISDNIQRLHMPYGTILDPVYASSDPASPAYSQIVGYSRAGDSAIWTGHYLAAEALRYQVTGSLEALTNAAQALSGIHSLLDITASDVLARCLVPVDSAYATGIQQEEGHEIYYNKSGDRDYFWIGNTSRDQYSGVMFGLAIAYDSIQDTSYFKFNVNYINLYNLIRLEENSSPYKRVYMNAYNMLRSRTQLHGNAHFNMLDRDLKGANTGQDAEIIVLLDLWQQRPRRDYWVDLRGWYPACGTDRACSPIPVNERVTTDFLWQRSPFLLYGGGYGTKETAGIDYILPYWLARRNGLTQ